MRKSAALALIPLAFLPACGGGGYTSSGGGGGGGQTIATPGPPNVETLTVDAGPAGNFNVPFISVTVCVPNTNTCKTIDHIEVDTGSFGLRIMSSVLKAAPALSLPPELDASNNPLAECVRFADGDSWGPLELAEVKLPVSGEATTTAINIQVIGDPAVDPTLPAIPGNCTTNPENSVAAFGANGIIGVGPFINDCNSVGLCPLPPLAPTPPVGPTYYSCPTLSSCAAVTAQVAQQVPNPVTMLGTDANGVIVELPSVSSSGAVSASGSLVFGIGTRTNNGLGSAQVMTIDPNSGFFSVVYKNVTYADGFMDSGSNGNFFNDSFPGCKEAGWYCPAATAPESASLHGTGTAMLAAQFSVENFDTLLANTSYAVLPNIAAQNPDTAGFDFGLPFYLGRNIFVAIENNNISGNMGPFFAY